MIGNLKSENFHKCNDYSEHLIYGQYATMLTG